ncbi:MAG: hypothetical protein ACJASC_001602 [Limimaricola cinnabarinus]|jgi:hypothetical protein|uniref:Uncharacterized protein n=1 Tax=Limimaricola cinnabarinus LL-001 TaxID=1337093 RepID=U3AB40_9RHOB|nr:hypothetical protein [Limimaricola cinnabarinus]GAD54874.1 hypothetical protein MBELCI_0926 [Limimaricola cinnabarinus LL-001]
MYLSNRATAASQLMAARVGRLPVRILAERAGGLNRDLANAAHGG